MRVITLHLPELYIRALDQLVNEKYYPNRAEAIRTAVKDLLDEEIWEVCSLSPTLNSQKNRGAL